MNIRTLKFLLINCFILTVIFPSYSQNDNGNNHYEIDDINITFKGTGSFEESDIKDLLASREGEIFDMATFINDAERIRKFLFDNGFFDAEVDTNIVYKHEDKELDENFIVKQNRRYVYYDINYKGLDSIDEAVRELLFKPSDRLMRTGYYYSKDTVKQEVTRVLNILFNNGYATANADNPEVLKYETNEEHLKGKANVNFYFYPRLRYVFGSTQINLIGKKKYNITKEDIAREITYSENKIYDKSEVVKSELNISKITILDNPRISVDKIDSIDKRIDFVINAVIGNKYDLTPEFFGYYIENYFYLGVGLAFSDKFFFGGGRVLTTRGRLYFNSFQNNRLEFTNNIFQPYLFNNRNISGNWNFGVQYKLDPESNVTEVKNSFIISFNLPDYTYINRLNTNWDITNQRISIKQDFVQDTIVLKKFDLNYFQSLIGLNLIHNSVNNIQFPFKGSFQSYLFEETGLLGNAISKWFNSATTSYFKFSNLNAAYKNLTGRETEVDEVIAGKIYGGVIFEYGDNTFDFQGLELQADRVPTDTRFVCGGSTSVRGWGAKQLGIVVDKNVGGNFLLESSMEYRIRPYLKSENVYLRDIGYTGFIDFGNVWSDISKFKINQLALAAGAGLRYYSIVGAIRFDIGLKVYDPQPGLVGGSNWLFGTGSNFSDKYHLQFGIGNTF